MDVLLWLSDFTYLDVIVFAFIMLILVLLDRTRRIKRKMRAPVTPYSPVLLSYHTYGKDMVLADEGSTETGANYQTFITTTPTRAFAESKYESSTNSTIYRVELPFRANIHLLAIPKNGYAHKLRPMFGGQRMETVVLEGDFPSHFMLYVDKGNQTQARYVLDPKSMAFVIDFCKSHSWEIIDDEFYFVQLSGKKAKDDPTHMSQDIDQFIREIRPAVQQKSQYATAGQDSGETENDVRCPVCKTSLKKEKHWLGCPEKHGIFISSKEVLAVRSVDTPQNKSTTPIDTSNINCPQCTIPMRQEDYHGSHVEVHSCYNCFHRWVHQGQLDKIIL